MKHIPHRNLPVVGICVVAALFVLNQHVVPPPTSTPNASLRTAQPSNANANALAHPHEQSSPEPELVEFAQWLARFPRVGTPQPASLDEGERLALARQRVLKQIIQRDPQRALALAASPGLKRTLPAGIARHLEEYVSGYATINKLASEGGEFHDIEMSSQVVTLHGRLYTAHSFGRRREQDTFQHALPLWGIAIDSDLAVAEGAARLVHPSEERGANTPGPFDALCAGCGRRLGGNSPGVEALLGGTRLRLCEPAHLELVNVAFASGEGTAGSSGIGPAPATSWTLGPKRLLYLVVQFADQPSPPTTRAVAEDALAQVKQFYRIESYGLTTLTTVVTEPLLLAKTSAQYKASTPASLYNDAVGVARASGWDVDQYDFAFVRYTDGPGSAAFALTGQKGAWVQLDGPGVIAHELGHNYGLSHANAWVPSTSSPYGPGATREYGDVFDTMGPNRGSFNPSEKTLLHWLPDSACPAITSNGTYRLHAFDVSTLASNRYYALTVRKDVRNYWLDYRGVSPGEGSEVFTQNGVEIRWPSWAKSLGGTTLLDTTPGTTSQFLDAPLTVGRTFSDTEACVHVTTLSRSPIPGEWLDVVINLGAFTNNLRPTASLTASGTNVEINQPITFTVVAADPDGDELAYGWDFALGSGADSRDWKIVTDNGPVQTHAWSLPGEYEVRCVVSDMKGGTAVASVLLTVGAPTAYFIAGQVLDQVGGPLANVRVFNVPEAPSGNDYRNAYTAEDGSYRLVNLPAGSHHVYAEPTPTHTFARVGGGDFVTLGPGVGGVDFVATAKPPRSIRGFVRDSTQTVPDVLVRAGSYTTRSDSDGAFALSNLPPASYVLTGTRGEDEFVALESPVYLDTMDLNSNVLNRVVYQLSGEIRGLLAPVRVETSEPGRFATALPVSGSFTDPWVYRLNVPRGLWNLYASFSGRSFTTLGFTNPVLVLGDLPFNPSQNVQPTTLTNLHFQAAVGTTYSIRGHVSSGGDPLPYISIRAGSAGSVTDSLGNYRLAGLAPGSYSVSASFSGYTFTNSGFANPVSVGPDAANIDFIAVPAMSEPPAIVTQPLGQVVNLGADATFVVIASGSPPLSYQWYFNNSTLLAGATTTSLTVTNVREADAGYYSVVVGNGTWVTSSNASLTVNHLPVPAAPVLEGLAFQETRWRISEFLGTDADGDPLSLYSAGPGSLHGGTVTTNADWVIYTPPSGFTNADSFPFAVSDGRGGIGLGTATVRFTFEHLAPRNLRAERMEDGAVRILFDGLRTQTYSIEFTAHLGSPWQKLVTLSGDGNGVFVYVDAGGVPGRFYRVTWP